MVVLLSPPVGKPSLDITFIDRQAHIPAGPVVDSRSCFRRVVSRLDTRAVCVYPSRPGTRLHGTCCRRYYRKLFMHEGSM